MDIVVFWEDGFPFVDTAPLTQPVRGGEGESGRGGETEGSCEAWNTECVQTQYGKALRLNHAFPIELTDEHSITCPRLDVDLEPGFRRFHPKRAWSLQVR